MHKSFYKYHGIGNDFLIFDVRKDSKDFISLIQNNSLISQICNRRFGIGGDGVILALNPEKDNFIKMRIFNSDGSEAEMCGNGIRCLMKYLVDSNTDLNNHDFISVETNAGIIKSKIEDNKEITVNMGKPFFLNEEIPTTMNQSIYNLLFSNYSINNIDIKGYAVGMGNPHLIFFVNDIDTIDIEKLGPLLEIDKLFPRSTNVHFAQIINKSSTRLVVWERGCGKTLACGTGACAVHVAANILGLSNQISTLELPGGNLQINWLGHQSNVFMTGESKFVFSGTYRFP
tara:strand:+ start:17470 stop:18330 length:861 start_codon:yes stop_codon:yes gene_type:complete